MKAAREGQILVVNHFTDSEPDYPLVEALRGSGLRSYVRVPMRDQGELLGAVLLGSDRPSAYTPEHVEIALEVANQVAIAIHQAVLAAEVQAGRERAEDLARRLIRAEEDVKRRIARDLHDEIGQALTVMKINLEVAMQGGEDLPRRLADSVIIVNQSLAQIRGMSLDLRPSILDDLGLVSALEWYVARFSERTGLLGRLTADPVNFRANPEIETTAFRIVQEALTNVARHARATRFRVELTKHPEGLRLVISDDGIGFDPLEAQRASASGSSVGLAGMRERVELVGGRMSIDSERGGGAEIQADFPERPILPRGAIVGSNPGGSR